MLKPELAAVVGAGRFLAEIRTTATRPPDRAPRRVMVITNFFELLKRTVPN